MEKEAKAVLEKYYELFSRIEMMPVADALEELTNVAEEMANIIENTYS